MATLIKIRITEVLEEKQRSLYWLAQTTGIEYATLWRMKEGQSGGMRLATLAKICNALDCTPGDLLSIITVPKAKRKPKP